VLGLRWRSYIEVRSRAEYVSRECVNWWRWSQRAAALD
jgi:hypothetical protein